MNVADVGRALIRHPIWLVLGLVVAVAAGGATFSFVAPQQQSSASVVILPPVFGDDVAGQNPFLNLDNTLAQLATLVSSALTSGTTHDELDAQGATAAYTIANVTGDNPSFAQLSPELQFTVTDADATKASFTAQALVTAAGKRLAELQERAGVADDARARVVTVSPPSGASVAGDGQIRAAGGVGLIVLVLAAAAVVLLDAAVTRRRRRKQLAADVRRPRIGRPVTPSDAKASVTTPDTTSDAAGSDAAGSEAAGSEARSDTRRSDTRPAPTPAEATPADTGSTTRTATGTKAARTTTTSGSGDRERDRDRDRDTDRSRAGS